MERLGETNLKESITIDQGSQVEGTVRKKKSLEGNGHPQAETTNKNESKSLAKKGKKGLRRNRPKKKTQGHMHKMLLKDWES